jgi:hypothetical protein
VHRDERGFQAESYRVGTGDISRAVASAAYTITPQPNFTLGASPASLMVDSGRQGSYADSDAGERIRLPRELRVFQAAVGRHVLSPRRR